MPKDFFDFLSGVSVLATILSFNAAGLLVISFWVPIWQKRKTYGLMMLKLALGLFCLSVMMMFGSNFLSAAKNNLLLAVPFAIVSTATLALSVFAYFSPSYIAFRENKKLFWYILPLNILCLQGNIWWALVLVWASMPQEIWVKLDKRVMGRRYQGRDAG